MQVYGTAGWVQWTKGMDYAYHEMGLRHALLMRGPR